MDNACKSQVRPDGILPEGSWLFAIEAYRTARNEIDLRLQFRERLVEIYVLGTITFFAAISTGIKTVEGFPPSLLLISPLLALMISIQLRNHVRAIELLAEHIRRDINPALIQLGVWMPHWDWHTRADKRIESLIVSKSVSIESRKIFDRTLANILAIHLPSLTSLAAYVRIRIDEKAAIWSFDTAVFMIASLFFYSAVHLTVKSYQYRKITMSHPAMSPAWWKDLVNNIENSSEKM